MKKQLPQHIEPGKHHKGNLAKKGCEIADVKAAINDLATLLGRLVATERLRESKTDQRCVKSD